jgi:light-regulated signal transduction histidine kinase (bacteriophytochrome)
LPQARASLPNEVLSVRQSRRLSGLPGDPQAVGLPHDHPPVHSFLCAPIVSPDRVYGWLCLADKLGAAEFNDEDEGLAQILAAQVGRIYENGSLYAEVKQYVAQLEAEAAERKRAEEKIRELNADLERRVAERTAALQSANHELEAFSYSVSHDLRAPLRGIQANCHILLEEHSPSLPEPVREYLRRIGRSGGRMSELIESLLSLSRISRHELRRSSVNLSEIGKRILDELKQSNPARRIESLVAAGLVVAGDPNLMQIALENLLRNAWKFTLNRPIARIEFGATEQEAETVFFVRDNGAGFDMVYADKLFGAFQRLHRVDEFEGTGIGLAIVQRIVSRHGGRIWAEAKVDEGATFYFSLSRVQENVPPVECS